MIEFRTFGGADLSGIEDKTARSAATQPKRLALIAYLATAEASVFRRRDVAVADLWPELDASRARAALRQALHALRRALGESAIVTRGEEEIGVNREVLWCDAVVFRECRDDNRFDEALALYRGDFLHGFFPSDVAPEFQQWIDDTRAELRRQAAECAAVLSDVARRSGDFAKAISLARRASELAPDDERAVANLIAILDASGDRVGALETYEALVARLKAEYDVAPSPETQELVRRVRERTTASVSPPGGEQPSPSPPKSEPVAHATRSRRGARIVAGVSMAAIALLAAAKARSYMAGSSTAAALRLENAGGDSLSAEKLSRSTPANPEAVDAYIKGRYYWNERRIPSLLHAVQLFGDALHADPTFALAYSAMGDAYVQLGYTNGLAPGDAFPKARSAATRALSLDSTLAEPHATLAFVSLYYDWDWDGADREFKRAIELNPKYATAHEWYGFFLTAMGRFDEAREQERRARELDPLSIAIAGSAGFMSYYRGALDEARTDLRQALRTDTLFPLGHFYLGRIHEQAGEVDSAMSQYAATGPLRNWPPTLIAQAHLFASTGRSGEAKAILARLDSMSHTQYVTAYGPALVYAELHQPDSAFAWLDRAYAERTNWLVWLNRDPRWKPIRDDPRFAKIVARMRLPE